MFSRTKSAQNIRRPTTQSQASGGGGEESSTSGGTLSSFPTFSVFFTSTAPFWLELLQGAASKTFFAIFRLVRLLEGH